MNLRVAASGVVTALLLLVGGCVSNPPAVSLAAPAELILYNAKVYSFAWEQPSGEGIPAADAPFSAAGWQPDATAVAISQGRILHIGDDKTVLQSRGSATQVFDLNGATVLPGLVDSHVHIAELGEILSRINLIGLDSVDQVLARMRTAAEGLDDAQQWVIGQGWDEGAWANNYPDKSQLDAIFPDNPVVLKSLHGFAVWMNSAALQAAGITAQTQAPVGGEILRNEAGEPNGILLNRATTMLQDVIPEPSELEFQQWIMQGLRQMAADGYVAVHEAGADARHLRAFQALAERQELPLRVYAMLSARDAELAKQWVARGPLVDPHGWLDVRSVKAYYDGALGSRGARLLDDYSDKPGHRGVSGDGYGFDAAVVTDLINAGFQVGIHAIGDAGNRETLDYLERVAAAYPASKALRHRIEHAQILHADDVSRFGQLGVIASMEPPHAVEDKTWAEERLGAERIKGAYAWRSLRQAGATLTFNSDLPGSDHSIFYGLHAAITRRDKNLHPLDGWYPQQALTIEEALRAYTGWAAYAAFRESDTGVLAAGRWADITVLDIDPLQLAAASPQQLLNGEVVMTIVNGNLIYQRAAAN